MCDQFCGDSSTIFIFNLDSVSHNPHDHIALIDSIELHKLFGCLVAVLVAVVRWKFLIKLSFTRLIYITTDEEREDIQTSRETL